MYTICYFKEKSMKNSAIVYIQGKNFEKNNSVLTEFYSESDFYVCPVKEYPKTDLQILNPYDFIGKKYADYAFCFNEEELFCFLALKISSYMLKKYESVA